MIIFGNMKHTNQIVLLLLIILSGFIQPCFSQSEKPGNFSIDGLVYGYSFESSKKLLRKEKQIKVEGVLDKVNIDLLENGKILTSTKTSTNGLFSLKIKTGKIYTIEFSKKSYTNVLLIIDLTGVPSGKNIVFNGSEFILHNSPTKNTSQEKYPFGKLYYNKEKKQLDFEIAKFLSKKQRESIDNSVSLMKRSVQKNLNNVTSIEETSPSVEKELKKENKKTENNTEITTINKYDTIDESLFVFSSKINNNELPINESDINNLEDKIKVARLQLEKDKLTATSKEDLSAIRKREFILTALELQLLEAKKVIELQKKEISTQKQLLLLTIICIALLTAFLFMIFRFNKQKKMTYLILKDKNKKITDSINYASRIQESILPSNEDIKQLLPDSFIFFKPRDIVSGDFYWLSKVNEKTIIACIDCTGHGVPGAFMSLIGNTLLNEIVNEKHILDPALILKQLHVEVIKALHQDSERTQSKDGMEMSICVIDYSKKEVEFAGAMNPLFIIKGDNIIVLKPDVKSIGGDFKPGKTTEFTNQKITIEKNMSLYMFTDGYMDQFGGPDNKKYNLPNFKKLLLEIQSSDMAAQKEKVEKTIEQWQGSQKQIDDMLVIGIRFN
ncbi:MAG: serine phosphatase RsbU, regulator of sigma subunit [Bacteroidetes bacterium]|jgi:serine phosphatase RsbU (regulator of sigma subunit)|nr:serine phosphatase RsbU, regulator of sigma subunit [Bacteroidota bacterium]